jgi:HAE1 family hydrophobic/amphiphilic exporter-1
LSAPTLSLAELNAFSDNLIVPALSTLKGVAQVQVSGQKRYAVRIQADPARLAAADLTLGDLSTALQNANSNSPVGQLDNQRQFLAIQVSGSLMNAADFATVVVATRQGRAVHLADVAHVFDSIENIQNTSEINGRNSILLNVRRQPDANTVQVVDAIRQMLPQLQAQLPKSVTLVTLSDRSISIRQAIHDVNLSMLLTIGLVVLVILLFLRRLLPAVQKRVNLAEFEGGGWVKAKGPKRPLCFYPRELDSTQNGTPSSSFDPSTSN